MIMFEGHDPYLVALSVAVAILGGYTGFGLAARIRVTPEGHHRVLLAGAAAFLAIGIWTMHFIGMLAAPLPPDTSYLILPTIVSFLICVLVVGVSLFFVSTGEPTLGRLASSAVLMGVGITSMHYVGMHGLSGPFAMVHRPIFVVLAALIAIGASYGGLRAFLARHDGWQLIFSAVAFGVAVSGMHYTAMEGMQLETAGHGGHSHMTGTGLAASQQVLSLVVAVLCFVVAAGFLLSLMPDPRKHTSAAAAEIEGILPETTAMAESVAIEAELALAVAPRLKAAPLGGLGQPPRAAPVPRLPIEGADGTHFIDVAEVRSIRADAHYTRVHDGIRERMCPWSISETEAQLDPSQFLRVHRSYIAAIPHIPFVRKEGDGAVIELDGSSPHRIPVSRAKIAEVKARLGLARRSTSTL